MARGSTPGPLARAGARAQPERGPLSGSVAVKAAGVADPLSTNMRLGQSLQRLYPPIADERPDRLGYLLMLLDRHLSSDSAQ